MRRPLLALAAATVALATSLASAPALADPRVGGDIAGCPDFPTGAGAGQAAGCTAGAWAAGRYDIAYAYASDAVTGLLHEWGRPDGRMSFSGCERNPQSPIVVSSLNIECSAYFDDPSWVHGWALYMGIDDYGYGAVVGHLETIG